MTFGRISSLELDGLKSPQVIHLKAGVTLVVRVDSSSLTTAVSIRIPFGSAHERIGQRGTVHLCEHLLLKRTLKRDATALSREIEDMGGCFEASTAQEHMVLAAHVGPDDGLRAVALLLEAINCPYFGAEDLDAEKTVIEAERLQHQANSFSRLSETLCGKAYGELGLGAPVLGQRNEINQLSCDDLTEFWAQHVVPCPVIIAVTGDIDLDTLVSLVDRMVESRANRSPSIGEQLPWKPSRTIHHESTGQALRLIGLRGSGFDSPEHWSMNALANILGRGMTSRLVKRLREELGVCYTVYAFHTIFSSNGILGLFASSAPEFAEQVENEMIKILVDLPSTLEDEEVDRVCKRMRIGMRLALATPEAQLERLSRDTMLYGHPIPLSKLEAQIASVNSETIRRSAKKAIAAGLIIVGMS